MFKVVNPFFIYFLAAALLLLVAYIWKEYRRKKQFEQFGNMKLLQTLMPTRSLARQRLKFALALLALVAVTLVCARLQYAQGGVGNAQRRNVELVAVVDVSNSMLCTDVAPSRLDKAKLFLTTLIDRSVNSRFGLVEFAGVPATRMPLTSDYSSAKVFVNSLSTTDISTQGTAVGAALRQAERYFSNQEDVGRTIILVTDMENHEDDAVATAKAVAEKGIQINVVGIGSNEGGTIPLSPDSVLHDEKGEPVVTKLDEQAGKEVANAGKGVFVRAHSVDDALDAVQTQIDKISKGNVDARAYSSFSDQFETFAWIAFVLLLADCLIMERKNHLLTKLGDFARGLITKKSGKNEK